LQELLLPKISDRLLEDRKHALALIQAGEELKKHESEDPEIRIQHKLYAQPYQKAIELLEKITREFPDYCPAYLSLGVAHENLSNFAKAAEGYGKYLEFGRRNKLPELDQEAQIRQRLIVCERRHQVDVELAKRVPGVWSRAYDNGREPSTQTYSHNEHTATTTTKDRFEPTYAIELLPDGGVKVETRFGWVKDGYWKVIGKHLIVGGNVNKRSEWCDIGLLGPGGDRLEGVNMARHRARYERRPNGD
jgi:tetratricopeptide (TPR) repeat protein